MSFSKGLLFGILLGAISFSIPTLAYLHDEKEDKAINNLPDVSSYFLINSDSFRVVSIKNRIDSMMYFHGKCAAYNEMEHLFINANKTTK